MRRGALRRAFRLRESVRGAGPPTRAPVSFFEGVERAGSATRPARMALAAVSLCRNLSVYAYECNPPAKPGKYDTPKYVIRTMANPSIAAAIERLPLQPSMIRKCR